MGLEVLPKASFLEAREKPSGLGTWTGNWNRTADDRGMPLKSHAGFLVSLVFMLAE